MSTPNNQIPYVPEGTLDPAAGLNIAIDIIDALLQTAVISMSLTAPPVSPSDGDRYIVAGPATGAWAGLEDKLVRYRAEGTFWQSFDANLVLNRADGGLYKHILGSPGGWTLAAGLSDAPIDGTTYARLNGTWVAAGSSINVRDDISPMTDVDPAETIEVGTGLSLTIPSPGVARIEATGGGGSLTVQDADSPPSETVTSTATLIIGDGLTLTEVSPGIAQIEATGGGGGSVADQQLVRSWTTYAGDAGSWAGFTLVAGFKGKRIMHNCASWKFRIECTVTGVIVQTMVARRTLANSTTFIDSTAVTIGGSGTPTLTPGVIESDPIAVPVDIDHDYYIMIFFNASTPSTAKLRVGSDAGSDALSGDLSGDHTADATVPIAPGTGAAYGAPEFIAVS